MLKINNTLVTRVSFFFVLSGIVLASVAFDAVSRLLQKVQKVPLSYPYEPFPSEVTWGVFLILGVYLLVFWLYCRYRPKGSRASHIYHSSTGTWFDATEFFVFSKQGYYYNLPTRVVERETLSGVTRDGMRCQLGVEFHIAPRTEEQGLERAHMWYQKHGELPPDLDSWWSSEYSVLNNKLVSYIANHDAQELSSKLQQSHAFQQIVEESNGEYVVNVSIFV